MIWRQAALEPRLVELELGPGPKTFGEWSDGEYLGFVHDYFKDPQSLIVELPAESDSDEDEDLFSAADEKYYFAEADGDGFDQNEELDYPSNEDDDDYINHYIEDHFSLLIGGANDYNAD